MTADKLTAHTPTAGEGGGTEKDPSLICNLHLRLPRTPCLRIHGEEIETEGGM